MDNDLRETIEKIIARSGAEHVAVALRRADGGELLIDADREFHAASTFKVAVMMAIHRAAARGERSLDEAVDVRNEFRSVVDGNSFALEMGEDSEATLYGKIGGRETLGELTRLMIVASSNLATNLLLEIVSPDVVTAMLRSLGIERMRVRRMIGDMPAFERGIVNTATARDLAALFEIIVKDGSAAGAAMLEILFAQTIADRIPAGLPAGVPVAHKTGTITGICHDVGYVATPPPRKPFILAVLTQGLDRERGAGTIAGIARGVYGSRVRGEGRKRMLNFEF